jgi:hypothetical protein
MPHPHVYHYCPVSASMSRHLSLSFPDRLVGWPPHATRNWPPTRDSDDASVSRSSSCAFIRIISCSFRSLAATKRPARKESNAVAVVSICTLLVIPQYPLVPSAIIAAFQYWQLINMRSPHHRHLAFRHLYNTPGRRRFLCPYRTLTFLHEYRFFPHIPSASSRAWSTPNPNATRTHTFIHPSPLLDSAAVPSSSSPYSRHRIPIHPCLSLRQHTPFFDFSRFRSLTPSLFIVSIALVYNTPSDTHLSLG